MTDPPIEMSERRRALLGSAATFNGVDHAAVGHGEISVHFINRVRMKGTLARDRPPVTLTVSGAAPVPVIGAVDEDADWSTDTSGRPVLHLRADLPDAPARYVLTVHSDRLDPCLRSASITVRGGGDAVDCSVSEPEPSGSLSSGQQVPVDYLAKDFASFLMALSNFSAARYPLWAERSEPDFGVMLMEVLSALADELSYLQDRVAAEATIGTATQRLSLIRHARLVDYEPMPALAASTVLQFDVAPDAALPEVIQVQALGGQSGTIDFAAGPMFAGPVSTSTGFARPGAAAGTGRQPALDGRWNRYDQAGRVAQLVPYLWDPTETWLRRGATSMWISGHGHGFCPGQLLLIDTSATTPGNPPVREIVQVTEAEERTDPVQSRQVTLIRWADRLASDHDLTRTEVAGNLLPAVHGRITDELFAIPGASSPPDLALAVVRADHSGSQAHYLHTLASPLAWQAVPAADGGRAQPCPMLALHEVAPTESNTAINAESNTGYPTESYTTHVNGDPGAPANSGEPGNLGTAARSTPKSEPVSAPDSHPGSTPRSQSGSAPDGHPESTPRSQPGSGGRSAARPAWLWVPRIVDADVTARAFTVTPERYSPAAHADGLPFFDYDGDGTTVRFGDGTFGRPPAPGTTFCARYLAGGGEAGNVAADTIVAVAPGDPANGLVWRCTNPFPATGGTDAETIAQIRDRAPQQIRSGLLSLTTPADYQAAALAVCPAGSAMPSPVGTGLFSPVSTAFPPAGAGGTAWARQAIAAARWTGSWLTTATIADPMADEAPAAQLASLAALAAQLNSRRLAGADVSVGLARYRWLDLRITCAARPGHRAGDVAAAVLARLAPRRGADGVTGFFGHDKWTFGQSLEESALMAAIQSCPGVAGVTRADYRWAAVAGEWRPLRATLGIPAGEILRLDNEQDRPGHGLLFVTAEATT